MKNLILLFSLFMIVSCSKDDSDSGTNSDFHPPKWIQGVWVIDSGANAATEEVAWTFTSNDFCYISTDDNTSHCQQDFVDYSRKVGVKTKITETITDTDYIVKYERNQGEPGTNTFKKISDNIIQWRGADLYHKVD